MNQQHQSKSPNFAKAFAAGIALNFGFVITESVLGILSGSMALLADAGHNLSDVIGLLLAWGATILSRRKPSPRRTYGWNSSSILAAMLNAGILLLAVGAIVWESVKRLARPVPVGGKTVIMVAAIGMVVNTVTALMFRSGRKNDLNIRGAFLHMAADAAVSAGVVGGRSGRSFGRLAMARSCREPAHRHSHSGQYVGPFARIGQPGAGRGPRRYRSRGGGSVPA